jgi:septal ring factor EnvC (AmiA/AmiB activator)
MQGNIIDKISDKVMSWVGTTNSIVFHTIFFVFVFASHWVFGWSFDTILLALTTLVSLEAIYLAIFIQRAVNQQSIRLDEVEETLDDVEDSIDDVEEALDDVEESLTETEGDIADIASHTVKQMEQPLDEVMAELRKILEEFKATSKK